MIKKISNISKKIKQVSIQRNDWKETFVFLGFLMLSLFFWVMQSSQQDYDVEVEFPIEYENMPSDIILTNDSLPESIKVLIRDRGGVMMNYSFGHLAHKVEIDLKTFPKSNNMISITEAELMMRVKKRLLNSTELKSITPSNIILHYQPRAYKDLPVEFAGEIKTERGYQRTSPIQLEPAMIRVYGTQIQLDSTHAVYTETESWEEQSKSISTTIDLQEIDGLTFTEDEVRLNATIEHFTEKELIVPINITDTPKGYVARSFPSSVRVICRIPLSKFKELTAESIAIEIAYEQLDTLHGSDMIPVALTHHPNWISPNNVTITPSAIEFLIEKK